jgi:hypothetical protein
MNMEERRINPFNPTSPFNGILSFEYISKSSGIIKVTKGIGKMCFGMTPIGL